MNRLLLFCGLFAIYGFVILQSLAQNITSEPTEAGNGTTLFTNEATVTTPTTTVSTSSPTNQTTQSTPIPTTLPTLPPPTTPLPPEAPTNPWNVSTNGFICILAEFALTLRIGYNSTVKDGYDTTGFNIPSDASVDTNNSYCNNITQVLSLNFDIVNQTMGNITFTFNQTKDNINVEKVKLIYQLTENLFPNYINKKDYGKMITAESDNLALFEVDHSHAYGCNSKTSVKLNNIAIVETNGAELEITKARVQAFMNKTTDEFSAVSECKADGTEVSDVVPIAVGASLAGLVLIVLIAYFVGRKRSRRLAYQSV